MGSEVRRVPACQAVPLTQLNIDTPEGKTPEYHEDNEAWWVVPVSKMPGVYLGQYVDVDNLQPQYMLIL